jgi:hypothetical protein
LQHASSHSHSLTLSPTHPAPHTHAHLSNRPMLRGVVCRYCRNSRDDVVDCRNFRFVPLLCVSSTTAPPTHPRSTHARTPLSNSPMLRAIVCCSLLDCVASSRAACYSVRPCRLAAEFLLVTPSRPTPLSLKQTHTTPNCLPPSLRSIGRPCLHFGRPVRLISAPTRHNSPSPVTLHSPSIKSDACREPLYDAVDRSRQTSPYRPGASQCQYFLPRLALTHHPPRPTTGLPSGPSAVGDLLALPLRDRSHNSNFKLVRLVVSMPCRDASPFTLTRHVPLTTLETETMLLRALVYHYCHNIARCTLYETRTLPNP